MILNEIVEEVVEDDERLFFSEWLVLTELWEQRGPWDKQQTGVWKLSISQCLLRVKQSGVLGTLSTLLRRLDTILFLGESKYTWMCVTAFKASMLTDMD